MDDYLLNGVGALGLSDFTDEERGALLRVIDKKYPDKFVLLSNTVCTLNEPDDWLKLHIQDLDNTRGFTNILNKITKSGKPVVGHNLYLDLIHLHRQFVGPLSEDYEEAKKELMTTFPKFIDTKLLANMDPLRDLVASSALPDLFKAVQKSPFKKVNVQKSIYGENSGDLLHQAGYDSYMTGIVFAALSDKLSQLKDQHKDEVALLPYFNKIFMFRSFDYNFVAMDKPDAKPSRKNVFHLTFPASFQTADIFTLFKSLGKINIGWINDTSAYVGLQDTDQIPFAMKRLVNREAELPLGVKVQTWESARSSCVKHKVSSEKSPTSDLGSAGGKKPKMTEKVEQGEFEVPENWA